MKFEFLLVYTGYFFKVPATQFSNSTKIYEKNLENKLQNYFSFKHLVIHPSYWHRKSADLT